MEKSLIDRLRKLARCHEEFEQAGGAADELYEAANRIEQLEQACQNPIKMDWKRFDVEKPNNYERVLVWFDDTKEADLLVYSHGPAGPGGYWSCEADGECFYPDWWCRILPPENAR